MKHFYITEAVSKEKILASVHKDKVPVTVHEHSVSESCPGTCTRYYDGGDDG